MRSLRLIFSVCVIVLLCLGYLASQYFWFQGDPVRWSQTIDRPPIAWLALLVLVAALFLGMTSNKEEDA